MTKTLLSIDGLLADALEWQRKNRCHEGIRCGSDAAKLPDKANVAVQYACPVCDEIYPTFEEAESCAAQPFDDCGLKVGTIVIIPGKRIYYEEENFQPHWCAFKMAADPSSECHFDHRLAYVPYYVVTAIHPDQRDKHRTLVTVCSLMHGKLSAGWNPADGCGHDAMFLPGKPREEQRSQGRSTWWEMKQAGVTCGDQVMKAQPHPQLIHEARQLAIRRISSTSLL